MKKNPEDYLIDWIKGIDVRFKIILISCFVWGFIAHGMALFNKYSVHDDISFFFGVGATYGSGRWFLAKLASLVFVVFGSGHYSTPLTNGLFSILCIALSVYLIVRLLDLKQSLLIVLICGCMTASPVIVGLFGYMFTAPYYMFALLMTVSGTYLFASEKKWYTYVLGTILVACAIGVYQAYIPFALSLMLLNLIKETIKLNDRETLNTSRVLGQYILWLIGCSLTFMLIYFIVNRVELSVHHLKLTDYQGISSMGSTGMGTYLSRVKTAYQQFFNPKELEWECNSVFPMRAHTIYCFLICVVVVLSVLEIWNCRKNISKAVWLALFILLIPLTTNFIFVMVDSEHIHQLMVYAQSMVLVYLCWLLENVQVSLFSRNLCTIRNFMYTICLICLLLISCIFCRYDNISYLKTNVQQQRAISYFTTLIANIKNTPGYKDEYPVVYINERHISDKSLQNIPQFSNIRMLPQPIGGTLSVINDYAWRKYMYYWCGYKPKLADAALFENLPEVKSMSSYPDDGSIKVIDDTVVVKF